MQRWTLAILAGSFLLGACSSALACDSTRKARHVREALDRAQAICLDVRTPGECTRVVCIAPRTDTQGHVHAVIRTAKAARTLGRALVTTVEAVVGSLVQVTDRTAAGRAA